MLNVPVLAINHHPKVGSLMKDLGLSEYCVDIEHCDVNALAKAFTALVNNRVEVKRRMAERLQHYRKELNSQFDGLFPKEKI
jgi:polysaccharide pyruvyl transferase WcaK-like protein